MQCGNSPILAQSWSRGERPRDRGRCGHWRPNSAFPSAAQFDDKGLEVTRLLLDRGADPTIQAKLPGRHDNPDDFVEGTALAYAFKFPGEGEQHVGRLANCGTIAQLREKEVVSTGSDPRGRK